MKEILEGKIEGWEQTGEATYYPKRTPEDGRIDWKNMDVDRIYDFIRAQTKPYPGAFSFLNGKKVTIWEARIFDRTIKYREAEYGQIVEKFGDDMVVNCLGGLLLVTDSDAETAEVGERFE